MLYNDISNMGGYTIAFKCEDFLLKFPKETLIDKVRFLVNKYSNAEIDDTILRVMEHLYKNTEYVVTLVVDRKEYQNRQFKSLIDNIPFNDIILIDKPTQITQRLITGDISYYIDDDAERRSLVNSEYAIPLSKLSECLKSIKKR